MPYTDPTRHPCDCGPRTPQKQPVTTFNKVRDSNFGTSYYDGPFCPPVPSSHLADPNYVADAGTVTYDACNLIGYTGVISMGWWRGRYGFLCRESLNGQTALQDFLRVCTVYLDATGSACDSSGNLIGGGGPGTLPIAELKGLDVSPYVGDSGYPLYHPNAPRIKYCDLTASINVKVEHLIGDPSIYNPWDESQAGAYDYTLAAHTKVQKTNGEIVNDTPDYTTNSGPDPAPDYIKAKMTGLLYNYVDKAFEVGMAVLLNDPNLSNSLPILTGARQAQSSYMGTPGGNNGITVTRADSGGYSVTEKIAAYTGGTPYDWMDNGTAKDGAGQLISQTDVDIAAGTFARNFYAWQSAGGSSQNNLMKTVAVTLTDTTLEIEIVENNWINYPIINVIPNANNWRRTIRITATLSDGWSDMDFRSAANSRAATWNLRDRVQMPLATGQYLAHAVSLHTDLPPLVTLSEVQSYNQPKIQNIPMRAYSGAYILDESPQIDDYRSWNSGTSAWNKTAWVDLQAWTFKKASGACSNSAADYSSGAPATDLVLRCTGETIGLPNTFVPSGSTPESFYDITMAATLIAALGTLPPPLATHTDWNHLMPIGRHEFYSGGFFISSKWAETPLRLPSFNHARPYGNDRLLGDWQNQAWKDSGPCGGLTGTPDPPPLRWPYCPPFGSRLRISSITDNGDGTATVTHQAMDAINNLKPDGTSGAYALDFCAEDMTALATNVSPSSTPTSTTSFLIASTLLATVAAAKWLVLYGALPGDPTVNWNYIKSNGTAGTLPVAHWYWADAAPKNQMVKCLLLSDNRTNGENTRLSGEVDCDGTNLSSPAPNSGWALASASDVKKCSCGCASDIIVLSDSASDNPSYSFPDLTDYALDDLYGSGNHLWVIQAMLDPLWQWPQTCNLITDALENDPTACIPFVEVRAILPHATGDTTPPDNGAGAAQDEGPPAGRPDYTMQLPTYPATGGQLTSPVATDTNVTQPLHYYFPTLPTPSDGRYCPPA